MDLRQIFHEDHKGGLVVFTLDFNTEVLHALNYVVLRNCTVHSHHRYIHFLEYNIHTIILFRHNNQLIINIVNKNFSKLSNHSHIYITYNVETHLRKNQKVIFIRHWHEKIDAPFFYT